jgi:hypothetical protein
LKDTTGAQDVVGGVSSLWFCLKWVAFIQRVKLEAFPDRQTKHQVATSQVYKSNIKTAERIY